jgi:ATP-binding cassette subfamily B protein
MLGPVPHKVVIDRYLSPVPAAHALDRFLSSRPLVGIARLQPSGRSARFQFSLQYLQVYFMQWAGQMVMFDLRREIFRHLQRMHIGFTTRTPSAGWLRTTSWTH